MRGDGVRFLKPTASEQTAQITTGILVSLTVLTTCSSCESKRQEMRSDGVEPNLINYNLAVRALGRGGDWQRATGLLAEMAKAGVPPEERTFNAAIEVRPHEAADW